MKAFSILQPWAWCIVHRYKNVENRSWRPQNPGLHFRGPFLVHAGKRFDTDGWEFIRDEFPHLPLPAIDAFERGGIVGKAVITDVVTEHDSPWFFGPYAFVVEDGEPLPFRPCNGQLGFFTPVFDPEPTPAPPPPPAPEPDQWRLL